MNRVTKVTALNKINEQELNLGTTGDLKKSWHSKYRDSAWIYIGGLPYELNEGDLLYGEIVNINLIRDSKTGKSKGFSFICYQDQRSTVLAVDNFNGIKLLNRMIQVDHCENYRVPKYKESVPEEIRTIWEEGCAPKPINISEETLKAEYKLKKKEAKKKKKQADEVVPITKEVLSKELREARKAMKKERKEMKKMLKRAKRERDGTPEEERGKADDDGRWDLKKKKMVDEDFLDDKKFYGANDHFNFGKKHKETPAGPTHNIRPDFDKADWRDIEMFKLMREHERKEKGEKQVYWKEEEHYVPNRLGGPKA